MGNYTMPLYQVEQHLEGLSPPQTIFPSSYTLYDTSHKDELESKILAHYWLREIGFETVDAFLTYFRITFIEQLGKANKYYEEYAKNLEIYKNVKETTNGSNTASESETTTGEGNGITTTNGSLNDTANSANVHQDTPYQNIPTGAEYASSKDNMTNTGTSTTTGSGTSTTTATSDTNRSKQNSQTKTHNGLIGKTEAQLMYEYLSKYEDVDNMIIRALDTCFMQVF